MAKTIHATIEFAGLAQTNKSIEELSTKLKELKATQSTLKQSDPQFALLQKEIGLANSELQRLNQSQRQVTRAFQEQSAIPGSYNELTLETKRLTDQFKNLAVGINATQQEYDELAQRIQQNNLRLTDMNRTLRGSASIAQRFREGIISAFKDITVQIGVAAVALKAFEALKDIGNLSLDLERGFAQVNTVAQLTTEEMAKLKKEVLGVARTSTAELNEVPGALFNILSGTGDVALSQDILAQSLRASKVGFSDINTTASAGLGIYNATRDQVKNMAEVYDVLFRTQKEGVLTFSDLSEEIPKIIPSANAAGVSFKQTAAALATITKAGVSAKIASTLLDRTLAGLANPERQAAFKEMGVSVFDAAGKTRSLSDIFGDLNGVLKDLNPEQKSAALKKLGLEDNAAKGVGILVKNIETLKQVSESIDTGSAGELERQFAASSNTADDLKIAINDLKVEILDGLSPAFSLLGHGVAGFVKGVVAAIRWMGEHKDLILIFTGVMIAANAATVGNTVATAANTVARILNNTVGTQARAVWAALTAVTALFTGQTTLSTVATYARAAAQRVLNAAMSANPIGLAIAGAVALAGVLLALNKRTTELSESEKRRIAFNEKLNEGIEETKKAIGAEVAQVDILFNALRKEGISKAEKKRITDKILEQYGPLLSRMDKEALAAGKIEAAYIAVRDAIIRKVIADKQQEAIGDLLGTQLDAQFLQADKVAKATGKTTAEVIKLTQALADTPEPLQILGEDDAVFQARLKVFRDGLSDVQKQALDFQKSINEAVQQQGPKTQQNIIEDSPVGQPAQIQLRQETVSDKTLEDFTALQIIIDETNLKFKEIEGRYGALGAASDANVGGAGDDLKGLGDEAEKAKKRAEELQKILEENWGKLGELQRDLIDSRIENIDDETERELAAEEERFKRKIQATLDAAAEILAAEKVSADQAAQAQVLQDQIIEELTITHREKLNQIISASEQKKIDDAEKTKGVLKDIADEELATDKRVLDLKLSTIEKELAVTEKNFDKKIDLLKQEKEARLQLLDFQTKAALANAKTEEESTEIMRNAAAERAVILNEFGEEVEQAREDRGPLLARVLGISEDELEQFKEIFDGFLNVFNEAIENFFARRMEALDGQLTRVMERLQIATERVEFQRQRIADLEAKLDSATGERRQRLIALIDKEREKQAVLHKEKVRQETEKARIEAEKAALEKKQAGIRKAQAIGSALINTAVGITKTIAEVPKADFGVSTAILIALYAALGAAQIGLIAAQQFEKGGKLEGKSHREGGQPIYVRSTGQMVEAEGGEYIVRKSATNNNLRAIERINQEGAYTRFNVVPVGHFPVAGKFAQGGQLVGADFGAIAGVTGDGSGESLALQREIANGIRGLIDKPSYVSVREIREKSEGVQVIEDRARI